MPKPSLLTQVLLINTLLVTVVAVVATVFARDPGGLVGSSGAIVLTLGIVLTVLANLFLLRRRFAPLERLIETMEEVDLAAYGVRARDRDMDSSDVVRLNAAFNRMLDRLEAERREAARAVLRAQEYERHRLAQDLHDEVNQALSAIVLRLQASSEAAPPQLGSELEETKRLAVRAMAELLRLAHELRPTALDDHGLLPALRAQVGDFSRRTGIAAGFSRWGPLCRLSDEQQLVIYRVTQESLSNVAQHAGAGRVEVELSLAGPTVLRVRDDGRGFSAAGPPSQGLGLSGMRERALQVGGQLAIRSETGEGTTIELVMR